MTYRRGRSACARLVHYAPRVTRQDVQDNHTLENIEPVRNKQKGFLGSRATTGIRLLHALLPAISPTSTLKLSLVVRFGRAVSCFNVFAACRCPTSCVDGFHTPKFASSLAESLKTRRIENSKNPGEKNYKTLARNYNSCLALYFLKIHCVIHNTTSREDTRYVASI